MNSATRLTGTLLLIAALAPGTATAQTCTELRTLHDIIQATTADMVATSTNVTTDIAIAGLTGTYDDTTLSRITTTITDPLLQNAENALDRMRTATALVQSACP